MNELIKIEQWTYSWPVSLTEKSKHLRTLAVIDFRPPPNVAPHKQFAKTLGATNVRRTTQLNSEHI